jgi:hypothetical protein
MAEKLLMDGRNRIEQQRLNDLAFVHYNLQLQNKRYGVGNNVVGEECCNPFLGPQINEIK